MNVRIHIVDKSETIGWRANTIAYSDPAYSHREYTKQYTSPETQGRM